MERFLVECCSSDNARGCMLRSEKILSSASCGAMMLDLFFRILMETQNLDDAYNAVLNEVNKRRLGLVEDPRGYAESKRVFERAVKVYEELKKMRTVFGNNA